MEDKNKNYISKRLTYEKDSLELYLNKYESYIQSRNWWQIALSLTITFAICFFTGNSKGALSGVKSGFDQFIIVGFALSAFSLIITIILASSKSNPVKKLKEELHQNYINKPDKNAIFVIKRNKNNEEQILVYKERAWGDAYFLPYVRVRVNDSKSTIKEKIASILSYKSSEINIKNFLDELLVTEKYHKTENLVKEFHSSYYHLSADQSLKGRDISTKDTFEVGPKTFEWKSLVNIEKDTATRDKNGDILKVLRENQSDFIINSSAFSQ